MRSNFATFYDVDPQYINYLKQIDTHIMNVEYANRNKFVYGVVLETSLLSILNLFLVAG